MNLLAFTRALAPTSPEKGTIYMVWVNTDHVESILEQNGHAVLRMISGNEVRVQESMEEVVDSLTGLSAEDREVLTKKHKDCPMGGVCTNPRLCEELNGCIARGHK